MYLSKVLIGRDKTINAYQIHQHLWTLFPDQADASRDFLFRVERQQPGLGCELLMQSAQIPRTTNTTRVLGQKRFEPAFHVGQRLRFRLRANPIKTIKDPARGMVEKNGRTFSKTVRVPLIKEDEQEMWLTRKFQDIAVVESLVLQQERPLYFRKAKEKRSGKIQPVLFDGVLTIVAGEAFHDSLIEGIGPAKSFGCGLLSLAAG